MTPAKKPQRKISFRAKNATKCPVCDQTHQKEELMSGGGRLIAGKLSEELRRLYEPSRKWGKIYPLAYEIQVCPRCLYAQFPKDFTTPTKEELTGLKTSVPHRQNLIRILFNNIDFAQERELVLGAASYILAVDSYHLRAPENAPTPKKAVCSIRAAWLLDELFQEADYRPYDKVRDFYYMEAARNYRMTLELMQSGDEPIEEAAYLLGPAIDHNWGYDGVIYLNAFLTKKYIDQMADTTKDKRNLLEVTKRYLSKLYGTGKASKSKPSVIVDMAKDLYDAMGELIDQYDAELEGPGQEAAS